MSVPDRSTHTLSPFLIALIILFTAGNTVLLPLSPAWYLQIALCGLFLIAVWFAHVRVLNRFYVLCAGEPAVILAGTVIPWAALFLQLVLLATFIAWTGSFRTGGEKGFFTLFCLIAAGIAAGILTFRHVFAPMLILGIAAMAAITLCWLAEYQYINRFRRITP